MFTQDISRALSPIAGKNGISEPALKRALVQTAEVIDKLQAEGLALIEHCLQDADIAAIEQEAAAITARFSTVIVFGMGGSSLSGKMLTALALNPFTQLSGKTKLFFFDNIDPASMNALLASTDYASTLFILISKSGGTAETLTHASILWQAVEAKLGANAGGHFLAITEERDNALRRFAAARKIRALAHDPLIGGRYAALTLVGLLPARIAGLDILAIRRSAANVIKDMFAQKDACAPAQGAAVSWLLAEQGKNVCVLMPYCDRLSAFAQWHRQIWAESLGKNGKGITPAPAIGSVDQHSQLQLYLDGPRDKFFTLLLLDQRGKGPLVPPIGEDSFAYLTGRTIGDLMDAHQYATMETFTGRQCPLRVISLDALDEAAIGALTMHFMLETILTGRLMNIDPFDQPAVEDGKKLAIARLSR